LLSQRNEVYTRGGGPRRKKSMVGLMRYVWRSVAQKDLSHTTGNKGKSRRGKGSESTGGYLEM